MSISLQCLFGHLYFVTHECQTLQSLLQAQKGRKAEFVWFGFFCVERIKPGLFILRDRL